MNIDTHDGLIQIPMQDRPTKISLLFAHRCIFLCKHCHFWKFENAYDSLSLSEWIQCLRDIRQIYGENVQIEMGGDGMASLNKNLIPLIRASSDLGFWTVLPTNGFLLNRELLRRIIDAGLGCLAISLDFITPEKHDKQRGTPQSYNHVMQLFEYLKDLKTEHLHVPVNTIIMGPNIDEIIPLTKMINNLRQISNHNFQVISQPLETGFDKYWYMNKKFRFMWPEDLDKVNNVIDELIRLKSQNFKISNDISQLLSFKDYFASPNDRMNGTGCDYDALGVTIIVNGDVLICSRKRVIGSVKGKSLKKILKSDAAAILRNQISVCSVKCHQRQNCRYYEN